MNYELIGFMSVADLFFGMLLASEADRRIGVARLARNPDGLATGGGAAEAAVFGLSGSLLPLRSLAPRQSSNIAGT